MRAQTILRSTLILGILVTGGVAAEPPAPPDDQARASATIKETEPMTAVSVGHAGPYWSLGKAFEKVREYMSSHELEGPLFVRYSRAPATGSGAISMEVGCLISGKHEADAPFKSAAWKKRQTVSTQVEAGKVHLSRVCAQLNAFSQTKGYETLGPVIEIHPERNHAAEGSRYAEVQMPVRPIPKDAVEAQPSSPGVSAETETGKGPPHAETPEASLDASSPDVTVVPTKPMAKPKSRLAPLRPIPELVKEKKFDLIAEQLLPDAERIHPELQIWVGQVVFRIRALGKGARKVFPKEAAKLTRLTDPIAARYKAVSVNFAEDPLAEAVVRVDNEGDPGASGKEAVVRDLDRLLARVAVKSVDTDAALATLIEIVGRAQVIVRTSVP